MIIGEHGHLQRYRLYRNVSEVGCAVKYVILSSDSSDHQCLNIRWSPEVPSLRQLLLKEDTKGLRKSLDDGGPIHPRRSFSDTLGNGPTLSAAAVCISEHGVLSPTMKPPKGRENST